MVTPGLQFIADEFRDHLRTITFPCVAARQASAKQTIECYVAGHMACPHEDASILDFIYGFVDKYRDAPPGFYSSVVIFTSPQTMDEELFDQYLWQRLQSLSDLDARQYHYDKRVDPNPSSPSFSFSLKEEAFYVIGMHPGSQRKARQYPYPVLVFNPHAQFERLREEEHFARMQHIIRKRDMAYSGSINPMLTDFGEAPEVFQYSGRVYASDWQCPLKINHDQHHSST